MFIHHAHLYCIECKTAKTMAHEQAKDVLYKLSSCKILVESTKNKRLFRCIV